VFARLTADYLIVGSGIAGLRAAVTLAATGRVLILTKAEASAGSTGFAQGGIAAAVGDDDSPEQHAADTIAAGDGLCNEAAVRLLVEEGPRYVRELVDWGAAFDRDPAGRLSLAREGAHSVRRVLHAHDATGREIGRTLAARVAGHGNVSVVDHAIVVQAIVEEGRVAGVRFLDRAGSVAEARAAATLLATGGAGQVYRETTNPAVATGDGVTVAYLAGAAVSDMEFVQFHPTVLNVPGAPRSLLSEALRGEGAHLINVQGERFMGRYDAALELAPRDRVARAIVLEAERTGGPVSLTMAHLPAEQTRARFPLVTRLCQEAGLDLARDPIPVAPAAHYLMGGVTTDLDGRTSLPGLFAAGETACTGVHGANRLASNSLLEGLVFGARAAGGMINDATALADASQPRGRDAATHVDVPSGSRGSRFHPASLPPESEVRDLMWRSAGIFRDRAGLERAVDSLDAAWRELTAVVDRGELIGPDGWRVASLVTAGRLIARAALRREESRGAHSRTDFPGRDDIHFQKHLSESRPQ